MVTTVPSFEELAAEYSGALFAYLARMTGNHAEADDLLQETLMRIARALPGFEQRASIKTWVYRIATNVAIDALRKRGSALETDFEESEVADELDEEDQLVVVEMNACVRGVIDSLPPTYRAPLVLFALEGKSVGEVAEVCGISVGTAKVRLHRARERLRQALEAECTFYESPSGDLRCDRKEPEQ